ncbi:MAG: P-loop NTPase [Planctomycetes bacterium]|jgi:MinD superfamily P-loop ATPase|nr:P-loop NTPase [Planctomycetota bacterium]
MKIAVSSGKGGTGKTTVATNLAITASEQGIRTAYLDCDVEEPNGFLFLKPDIAESRQVNVSVPRVDLDKCVGCGQCGRICQYSAIVSMNKQVLVFDELCHGCGGCMLVCKAGAITESFIPTGRLDLGRSSQIECVQGLLDIGRAMSPPVIRAVKDAAPDAELLIIDSPPGTSCPVIESVRGADLVLLVTEPTPFGLNDLKLAVDMVNALKLPLAVVINRSDIGNDETRMFCHNQNIDILCEIPFDRRVAEAYSRGVPACRALSEQGRVYADLLKKIMSRGGANA